MPAIWEDDSGRIHYYIPPPPPPPPPPAKSPQFKQAVNTAGAATTAYQKNPNKANTTALNNDWNTVQEMIAEQYRLALSSSDPAKEVAALNQQYGQVFQGGKGASANIYNEYVLPAAQKEAKGETPGERNAEIQLYNGLNEPDSSPTKGYDVAKADIGVHLQKLYGNGTDGVYTAAQYKAAEAAADKDFGSTFAPVITGVGNSMQQGESYDTLLKVLQTGLKLTPAQVAALGDLLTPEEKNSKTLILTPGQAQLAKIDPVTLSLLMTAGIKVPELSPQMLQIAKSSPSTFFYMEANGINISVVTPNSCPPSDIAVFNLGNGKRLDITINDKPLTTAQLPPGPGGTGRPSTGQTPSTVLGVYLSSEAASKGSGVVVPGSVAVANLLLGDPHLNLQVTPKTLSNPTTPQLRSLTFLVSQADSARPGYVNTTLSSLLAAAPPPGSKDATAYFANVINPFLTTQSNGFFSSDDAVNFWNSSPVIDNAGAGSDPKSSLHAYLQSWLGTLPNDPTDQRQMLMAGGRLKQMLAGAPPGLARMLIPMVEGQVNKLSPQNQSGAIAALFDGLSGAVQIADQFPVLSTAKNPPTNSAATQVAGWLDSLGHHEAFYSLGVGDRLYDDTAMYGYTDLANALTSYWPTGILATDIQNGEHDYNSTLQKQLGTANYDAFQNNKAQVLNGFFGQYSNVPNIGKPISTSNTAALKQAIIAAYGFTPKDLAPVTTHNGTQTVKTPSQATNIVNTDLSWIQNQSIPGSTVTILPFMFASAGLANGTEGGVFFDVWNPPHKETRQSYEGRAGTRPVQVETGPSHVLIDGSAAVDALQVDPNVWQHPGKSDVKWHYSSYRDFQLSNTDYQNGTIYTLPGNQLGIGPDGAASSATDFHKEFDSVMGDVVGASQVVGLVLAPFTDGLSLAITGSLGLVWGTYQGIEGYDDAKSHGENFSLSNPNTRWEAISDITVAAGWATLGVAGTEAALARDATGAAGTLETATDEAGTLTTIADEPGTVTTATDGAGTVTTAADQPGVLDGAPALATAPGTVASEASNTLRALGVTKKVLEYGNYGLATAQTGKQIQSFSANSGNMSFWQQVNALAGIFEATVPFAAEPMNQAAFGGDWSRPSRQQRQSNTESGRQQPDAVVLNTDVTSEPDSGLEGRPQTATAIAPDLTMPGEGVVPITYTSDGRVVPVAPTRLFVPGRDDATVPVVPTRLFVPGRNDAVAPVVSGRLFVPGRDDPTVPMPASRQVETLQADLATLLSGNRVVTGALNRYYARNADPTAGNTATPGEGTEPVSSGEVVPPPTASGGSSPPNAPQVSYTPTSNLPPDIVIIGGGNVGHMLQTDLTLNGQSARLLFRGDGRGGQGRIEKAAGPIVFNEDLHKSTNTTVRRAECFGYMDTEQGLADMRQAKILVATIPDAPQARLQLFRDFLAKGLVQDPKKTIVLIRGGQAGQAVLSQMIRDNPSWKATMVLVEDSPYGGRYNDDDPANLVINTKRKDDVEISVLAPNGATSQGLVAMQSMFPLGDQIGKASWPNFTVIDGSAMPFKFGYAIHPRVAFDLTNLRMTINGKIYRHYNQGIHPALGDVLEQLDHERVQLAAAYGVQGETFPQKLERQFDLPLIQGEPFYRTMQRTWLEKGDPNPDPNAREVYKSMSHESLPELMSSRYPQEDVPGLFTMNWYANRAGLVLPGHVEYESYIRDILRLLGMPDEDLQNKLGAYLPHMDQIPGGVPEIKSLLDAPYDREPPPGEGRESITVKGPQGPKGPGGGTTPSRGATPDGGTTPGERTTPTSITFTAYHPTTNLEPTVALVGGGNVGHTLLTDLTDAGQQARLLFRGDGSGRDRITPATGTVTFNEQLRGGTHTVRLDNQHFGYMDTPEGQATLQQAKIIVITMPDAPQSRLQLFRQLQENGLVQDPNKTIVLIRAGQAGQPVLSQMIRANPDWHASVVLVEDSPYGTRYKQAPDGNIITGKRKDDVEISVLGPDGNIVPGLIDMRSMFPLGDQIGKPSWPDFSVIPGSAMPFKFGYVIHPRVAFDLRNLRMTVNGQTYLHYNEGVYPELGRVLGQLDDERVQLAAAYGVHAETFPEKLNRQFDLPLIPGESFHGTMLRTLKTDDPNSRQIYVSTSHGSIPDLLGSRYPQEDVPGLFTMNWFANRAGLVLPAHAEYESYIRDILGLLGMPDEEMQTKLEGYLPQMEQIPGGVPEIKNLLDTPHDRPTPGGRESITLSGPPGPQGPGGGMMPSGGSGSPPDVTSAGFFLTSSDPGDSEVDVRQGDIRGVMAALLPNEQLPIVAKFGGGRDWARGQGLRRSLTKAGYSDAVVTQVSQSVGDLTRPAGRTTVSHIKGFSADDHSRIQALLSGLPEGYGGAYGANLLVHLAGLSSGERDEVLANAESLTPEQMSNLVGLVGDMPSRYDARTAASLTAFVWRFPGTSNVPDGMMSNLTELGALTDRASNGPLTNAELGRQNELIHSLRSQAAASNLPDPLASFPSTSRRPWLAMVTDVVTSGLPVSDATRGDYSASAKVIAGRLRTLSEQGRQGGSADPLNLFIQTGAPAVGADGNIVASAYGPAGTALHLRDVLAAASDKSLDVPINVTIVTDQSSRASVIASLAAAGIRTRVVNIDTSSSPARQAALVSRIGPGDIFLSIGHSDRNGGRASLLEAANGRGATTFVIDDGTLGDSPTLDQADDVLKAWNPDIGAQALSGSVLRELGLSKLMHGPEQVRAVYQAATAKPADLATVTVALEVDDAIRTSDTNKVDATTQAAAARAAASRATEALKGGDPATAVAAAAEAADFAKAALTSAKAAVRGTDVFAARVVDALPEAGDTADSKKAATKARATARAATTASTKATTATVAYREAAPAVGIAVTTAADAQAALGTPDANARAALAVTTAITAAKKATRAAKAASTVEVAAALRPAAKIKAAAIARTIEAQARIPSIAILDDDRFVPGAAPATFSVDAREGNWHLLVYSLGPKAATTAEASRPPTWVETYNAWSNPIDLGRSNTLLERARPPEEGVVDKFALTRFKLSQQSTGEKVRTYAGAAAAVTAAGFLYGTAHVGWAPIEDVIAGLTLAGTSIRRVQLVKATLVTRLFQANRAPSYTDAAFAPPKALQVPRLRRSTHSDRLDSMLIASQSQDPASLAEAKWRVMKNDRTRFATFTVSTAAAVSGAGHAFLTAHGIPLDMQVTADFVVGGALTAAQWAAARKLLTARFFPDGRLYAHPSPKVYDSKPSWVQKITQNTVGNYFEILSGELALNVVRVDVLLPNTAEASTDPIALDLHAVSDMVRALQRQISARFKAAGAARGANSPAHPPGEGRFSAWVELVASSGAGAGIELGDTYDTIHEGIDLLGQGGSGAE